MSGFVRQRPLACLGHLPVLVSLLILCRAAVVLPMNTFAEDPGGTVSIEAEEWSSSEDSSWAVDSTLPFASAGAYIVSRGVFESRARAEYIVDFATADTFYVFLRTWAASPGDNGVFLELDGRRPDNPGLFDVVYFYKKGQWDWNCRIQCGERCHEETPYFVVSRPGKHILALRVRETGAKIDRIVLKKTDTAPVLSLDSLQRDERLRQDSLGAISGRADTSSSRQWRAGRLGTAAAGAVICFNLLALFLWAFFRKRVPAEVGEDTEDEDDQAGEDTAAEPLYSDPVKRALAYIEEHLSEELSLSDIAERASLTPNYLGKLFKDETGKTIVTWINDHRVDTAIELMRTTRLNISQIQQKVGINHPSYFSKVFRNRTGMAPSEMMRKVRR